MKNKIGIIGIRGLPAKYGAFDTFVDQLIKFKNLNSNNFFFVSCDNSFKKDKYNQANVKRIFLFRGKGILILFNYFFSIIIMLFSGVRKFIFFGYGAAVFFPIIKLFNGKIICNPDGIEWRRPEGKLKKIFFKFSEILISKQNIIKIFDSKVIKKYYGIIHQAKGIVVYYPSGFEDKIVKTINKQNKIYERFYILGRLLKENNTEMIVKAFTKLEKNQKLYIIGSPNKYFNTVVMPLVKQSNNIYFLGPIYNREKLFKICSCFDYYIHGHSVGGTNPTLIEAVNLQKIVISFKTFFNREILKENAIYFKNIDELLNILKLKKYQNAKKPSFEKLYKAKYINNIYLDLIK